MSVAEFLTVYRAGFQRDGTVEFQSAKNRPSSTWLEILQQQRMEGANLQSFWPVGDSRVLNVPGSKGTLGIGPYESRGGCGSP